MKKQLLLLAAGILGLANAQAQNDPNATVGDTGTVTFNYMGSSVTYTTVRAADGMVWLQQNLGATQIATSATDPLAYGDYFQWGRWDDGHQPATSTTVAANTIMPNDPSGIPGGNTNFLTGNNPADWWSGGGNNDTWADAAPSSNNGTDPCAAIGPGWHLATQSEFANAITLEGITDVPSAFASNLVLTAAGQREPVNGTMQNVGLYGQYWTSTPSSMYAKAVSIQPASINANDDALRSYGGTMRCLTTCTGVFAPTSIMGDDTVCAEDIVTYSVPAVDNADSYSWILPSGWTVIGPANESTIVLMAGISGTISAKAVNSCDSSAAITLDVLVSPLPTPTIIQSGSTLSTSIYTTYQWMVNDTIIVGATNSEYTFTDGGDFQVIVTDANGCSDTSTVFNVPVSVHNIPGAEKIQMYPNPAVNTLNISAPFAVNVSIYSIDGRIALQAQNATSVDISNLPSGTYHVRLSDTEGRIVKMEKLSVLK